MSETPTPDVQIVRSPSLGGLVAAFRNYAQAAANGTTPDGTVPPNVDARDPGQLAAQAYAHCASLLTMHVDRLAEMDADRLNGPDLRARLRMVEQQLITARAERLEAIGVIGTLYCAAMGIDPETTPPGDDLMPDDPIAAVAAERTHLRDSHQGACTLVAEMHAAATGRKGEAPHRGVVEDVQDVGDYARTARAAFASIAATLETLPRLPSNERKQRRDAITRMCRELVGADDAPVTDPRATELLHDAWGVIANAGLHRGNWDHEHPEWVAAAERWRSRFHVFIGVATDNEQAIAAAYDAEVAENREQTRITPKPPTVCCDGIDGQRWPAGATEPQELEHDQDCPNVPVSAVPVNTCEADATAVRRFAGELWRLESGLADRGIAVEGPVGTAAVDTALRFVDQHRADNAGALGLGTMQPTTVPPAELADDPAMLPELAQLADDPAAEPNDALLRDMGKLAQQYRGVAYDPQDRPAEILAVRRAAYRAGLVPFPSDLAPPRGYRGATPPTPKLAAAAVVTHTTDVPQPGTTQHATVVLAAGDTLTVSVQP